MTILYKQNTFSIDVNGERVQIGNPELAAFMTIYGYVPRNKTGKTLKDGDTFEVDGIGYTLKTHCDEYHEHSKASCKLAILHLIEQAKVEQVEEKKYSKDDLEKAFYAGRESSAFADHPSYSFKTFPDYINGNKMYNF